MLFIERKEKEKKKNNLKRQFMTRDRKKSNQIQ